MITVEFNVAQQLRETSGSARVVEIRERNMLIDETIGRGDVAGQAVLLRTNRGILVTADVEIRYRQGCSRCLQEAETSANIHFQEEYLPTVDIMTGAVLPPPDEEEIFLIDSHHILDLHEAIRQYSILSLPMQPLCRSDCAGLCLRCGANLNVESCRCGESEIDARWSALEAIWRARQ